MSVGLPTAALRRLIDAKADFAGLPEWRSRRYSMGITGGEWLEGLVLTESNGNPRARRYESHQDRAARRDAPADPDTVGVDDGELEDDASYGLTQVMGYNIRVLCGALPFTIVTEHNNRGVHVEARLEAAPELHFAGGVQIEQSRTVRRTPARWAPMSFAWAFLPDTNLTLGLRVLLPELRDVGGDVERALARYNGGPTGDDVAPEYGNDMRLRAYVDRVAANAQRAARDRAETGYKPLPRP